MSFKEEAALEAKKYTDYEVPWFYDVGGNASELIAKVAYCAGARWGYRKAIEELRSDAAPRNIGAHYPYNHAWASWLEAKLSETKEAE